MTHEEYGGELFPGSADAGAVLKWISRQISSTSLGASLRSALEEPCDIRKNLPSIPCQQVEPQ